MNLRERAKRRIFENKVSDLQKKILKYLEPENLYELEKEIQEILRAERALMKVASRLNVSPDHLQKVLDDLIDIINLLQI